MSLRASVTSELYFDNVVCPKPTACPVPRAQGPAVLPDQARYGITWGGIGSAQACLKRSARLHQPNASSSAGR
jgi:glutaryl-CoA dehydrogenase